MILAGDIGGTKTNVALFALKNGVLRRQAMETYASREHRGLDEIIRRFLAAHRQSISRACFGVAGPVKGGRIRTTNLPWVGGSKELADRLGLRQGGLVNGTEAPAWGIG